MRDPLRAGVAIYNEGRYHAAHDAWEDHWLDLSRGTDDERLLHGLIQFTAVVHHLDDGNYSGATGLAESAAAYLADLPAAYRGVELDAVRSFLGRVATAPRELTPDDAPPLVYEGRRLTYDDLDFEATAVAARVLAEGDDEHAVEAGVEYAREEVAADESGTYTGLVFAFVRERDRRPIVTTRLGEHVQRREHRESDVNGLFE
ncbi:MULTISPECIES: DUF309 domain-containing protein [Halomicrobium]|uniref:DUF309 domain-containing protein n=2 Tax=Halomicrobium mukohataei TaxID=57705 RepID=C7NYP1_HALMD|nr:MULTISPECIES: DUF309 domain-containing protein [Halomicrobium]ACV46702.1 protein of unknown function DUF309 [Halomicrobium mukohataei DSM 12286]QCD65210.1 DUF309 domain-containing protein [Halomicrobium mukohataei]QFR20016.1 DUF309 domain-containing protein [Halomicrobium sp. ZPS1]